MNDFKLKPMKNATKIAFLTILILGFAQPLIKANFSLSFPLFIVFALAFYGFSTKLINIDNQIVTKFDIKTNSAASKYHSIFLNHKNSII